MSDELNSKDRFIKGMRKVNTQDTKMTEQQKQTMLKGYGAAPKNRIPLKGPSGQGR